MTAVLGIDVGGTKTQLRVEAAGAIILDHTFPSHGWSTHAPGEAARWLHVKIADVVRELGHAAALAQVAVGAQGCESERQAKELSAELTSLAGLPCLVVNDAELVVPAAGLQSGIGMIAGTGSVVVGRHAQTGAGLSAGGWGWVLGDEGSASALVRDAARAVLTAADRGLAPDLLAPALLDAFGVSDLGQLAMVMSWDGGVETWAPHAPLVFEAAASGSALASGVITAGGSALARLVDNLVARGASGEMVVAAGGVITSQETLQAAVRSELAHLQPRFELVILDQPPVVGAVKLARDARQDVAK
ncbi:N-acetylglucosamine kinase [Arthrobacter sp. GMC3]|uniref:N-acetylglucosamine kinase n=1 Tax=Arthrobacter sp. GMC3 TaxID=2058894 RepID=UPI000CE49FB1|nr:BadF/BadG/BcrA/BcrD ATPase family protein [Arthrobacter sp. GMC3]